jgi:hypothetical protein
MDTAPATQANISLGLPLREPQSEEKDPEISEMVSLKFEFEDPGNSGTFGEPQCLVFTCQDPSWVCSEFFQRHLGKLIIQPCPWQSESSTPRPVPPPSSRQEWWIVKLSGKAAVLTPPSNHQRPEPQQRLCGSYRFTAPSCIGLCLSLSLMGWTYIPSSFSLDRLSLEKITRSWSEDREKEELGYLFHIQLKVALTLLILTHTAPDHLWF